MKKLFKFTFVVFSVTASCFCAWNVYVTSNDTIKIPLLEENIEALSDNIEGNIHGDYQYLGRTGCPGSSKLQQYCSTQPNKTPCTFHCGKKV